MAQTMLLTSSSVSNCHVVDLKRDPLLQIRVQRLKAKPFSQNFTFNPLTSSKSPAISTVFALFKSKTKAAPTKKVRKLLVLGIRS